MLIKSYGAFWRCEYVDWGAKGPGNKGKLVGVKVKDKQCRVDFWEETGVYALFNGYQLAYVGQAGERGLGARLRDHRSDRLAGQWDTFSWFGLSTVKKGGTLRAPGTRQVSPDTIVKSLEAITLFFTEPPLNRRVERVRDATEFDQVVASPPVTEREQLHGIHESVNALRGHLGV